MNPAYYCQERPMKSITLPGASPQQTQAGFDSFIIVAHPEDVALDRVSRQGTAKTGN